MQHRHPQAQHLRFQVDGRDALVVRVGEPSRPTRELTESEADVAALLIDGHTYRDIASYRGTSVHTVSNQVRSAFRKLGVHSRVELSARLSEQGSFRAVEANS